MKPAFDFSAKLSTLPSSEFLLPCLEGDALEERWAGAPSHRDSRKGIGPGAENLGRYQHCPRWVLLSFHPVSMRGGGVPGVLLCSFVWPSAF